MNGTAERAGRRRAWAAVAPALLWTAAFFVAPFALMVAMSLWRRGDAGIERVWTFENYRGFFERPAFLEALANSLEITLIVTVLSVLLAYPLAALIAYRVPARLQRLALALAVLPFWTSYVVRSYAWSLVLADKGVLNRALADLGLPALEIAASRAATVTGFVHFFVMLLTLTIYAALRQLPAGYARAAADLGAGPVTRFRLIVLPLTLPGVAVGAFLTFVLAMGDYITPQILGQGSELTLAQVIMLQLGRRADLPMAAALSVILMIAVTLAYLATARWLRLERV
ncbi:MAG: ABC transporter permease [Pseudomonadota bacterium]